MPEETAGAGLVKPYRILSLDGGGTWALIQAMALQKLFGDQATGWDVLKQFDLVVANSGGSIVAGGLVANMTLAQIVNLFDTLEIRQRIFAPIGHFEIEEEFRRWVCLPRYDTAGKREALSDIFGKAGTGRMCDWSEENGSDLANLLIIGFDYDFESAVFFRTDPGSLASFVGAGEPKPTTTSFLDAIHASSTPPALFFNEPASHGGPTDPRYWDGAMAGYNNPIVAGIVEVLANGAAKRGDIRVLSMGTGIVPRPSDYRSPVGIVNDAKKAGLVMLDEPPETATFVAHVFLDGGVPKPGAVVSGGPIVRMSPVAAPGTPDYAALCNIQLDAIKNDEVAAILRLAERWLGGNADNQPIRPAAATAPADIGHDKFLPAAKEFWSWYPLQSRPADFK
jgi:hypothetical protein